MVATRREFVSFLGAGALGARNRGGEGQPQPGSLAAFARQFPALRQRVNGQPLVYLDSAATTLRPQAVIDALVDYYSTDNANPSPVHTLAARAAARLSAAREAAAHFVNAASPSEIIFVRGTTEGMNLVASTWGASHLSPGDEVVLSVAEHASNLMPWARAAERAGARVRVADVDDEGRLSADAVRAVLSDRTRLVAFSHVSNVLGFVNPVREIARLAKTAGAMVAIDGAQGAPHVRVDVQDIGCDFYVWSGHKMLGPMGTGAVWGRRELLDRLPPYHVGSNMAHAITLDHLDTRSRGARSIRRERPTWPARSVSRPPSSCSIALATKRFAPTTRRWSREDWSGSATFRACGCSVRRSRPGACRCSPSSSMVFPRRPWRSSSIAGGSPFVPATWRRFRC